MAEITWHNEKRAIRDLIPYEVNPRQITNKQAKDLKASLAKFGIADPIIINTDNMIIGGHQRKKAVGNGILRMAKNFWSWRFKRIGNHTIKATSFARSINAA